MDVPCSDDDAGEYPSAHLTELRARNRQLKIDLGVLRSELRAAGEATKPSRVAIAWWIWYGWFRLYESYVPSHRMFTSTHMRTCSLSSRTECTRSCTHSCMPTLTCQASLAHNSLPCFAGHKKDSHADENTSVVGPSRKNFDDEKARVLAGLQSDCEDNSKKGDVDVSSPLRMWIFCVENGHFLCDDFCVISVCIFVKNFITFPVKRLLLT